jgi:hypothetical protein
MGTTRRVKIAKASELSRYIRFGRSGDPYGIRTRVAGVKGQCPRPLDEGVACLVEGWDCLRDRIAEIKARH